MWLVYSHPKLSDLGIVQLKRGEKVIVGRPSGVSGNVDIDLSHDQLVSRKHLCIWQEEGAWWIKDLGSTHGTIVDGKQIKRNEARLIEPGVRIVIGNTYLWLVDDLASLEEIKTSKEDGAIEVATVTESSSSPALRADVFCHPELNYSLVHAQVPFIKKITIINEGEVASPESILRICIPGFVESDEVKLPLILTGRKYEIESPPALKPNRRDVRWLTAPVKTSLEILINDVKIAMLSDVAISVLPPNAWQLKGQEIALAGFVMLHCDAVKEIVTRALFQLQRLFEDVISFADAVNSSDPDAVEKTMRALFYCLQERYQISYDYEPRSYDHWQLVRFPDQVLRDHRGTCIDLVVLLASCIEHVHRDPVIIIICPDHDTQNEDQHALIGCWTKRSPLKEVIITCHDDVRNWVARGDLIVLDLLGLTEGEEFQPCVDKGEYFLSNRRLCYAIDIRAAREQGFYQMPFEGNRPYSPRATEAVFKARQEAKRLKSDAISARHLLLGLISLEGSLMRKILQDDTADKIIEITEGPLRPKVELSRHILPETDDFQSIISSAEAAAKRKPLMLIEEEDLVRALLKTPTLVHRCLREAGIQPDDCLEQLDEMISQVVISEWRDSQ